MVQLVAMNNSDFQSYLENAVHDYAQEHITAGNWHPSEAMQKAEQEIRKLLPDGPASKDQFLYSIVDEKLGVKVGMVWFAIQDRESMPKAFIYDFLIFEELRRRGYGTQALSAVEEKVKELGVDTISLHVFAHNQAARGLYEKTGFNITDIMMSKKLT